MMTVRFAHWVMVMSKASVSSSGWLLHRRPYRNSSLIVELLTASHGRIVAVARAGRKANHFQPFIPQILEWRGAGELHSLTLCEPAAPALPLQGDALYCGLYLNELLIRVLHREDPHPEITEAYQQALSGLLQTDIPHDVVLRYFEMQLLEQMGYGVALHYDALGAEIVIGQRYRFEPEQGWIGDVLGDYDGQFISDLVHENWTESVRKSARQLMREALAPHLGPKPLFSRQLFRQKVRTT